MTVVETRQSRRGRSHIPLRVRIGPRDLEIFKLLTRYRYLRKHVLHALIGGNAYALTTRLGELYRAHYLNRPKQQWDYFNANYRPAIYELDQKGKDALVAHGLTAEPMAVWPHLWNEFAHNVMLCDVLANIDVGAKAYGAILNPHSDAVRLPVTIAHTFKNGRTSSSTDPYNPDAAFTIRYPSGRSLHFVLEVDTGSESLVREGNLRMSSYFKKLLQLQAVFKTRAYQELGFNHLWALHVTSTLTRRDNLMQLCGTLGDGKSKSNLFNVHPVLGQYEIGDNHRYVSCEPAPDGTLFGEWQRPGYEPFNFIE
jgi:hypothetical protein